MNIHKPTNSLGLLDREDTESRAPLGGVMNDESRFPYPEWQIPAQDVLIEIDADKLPGKGQRAEAKIAERLQQIPKSKNAHHKKPSATL